MKIFGSKSLPQPLVLRGALLWPSDDLSTCTLIKNGCALIARDGSLVAAGNYEKLKSQAQGAQEQYVDGVIAPAFADLHLHWVQHHVVGQFAGDLLGWLTRSIFPAEAALIEPVKLAQAADDFWKALINAGTLCAGIYASSFEASVDACLERAIGLHICGDSVMTTDCPEVLRRDPQESFEGVKRLHAKWGDAYAVTPRFALSVGEELMTMLGSYAREHNLAVQTHLAENFLEVERVKEIYPQRKHYTDVYDHAGLLGPKTILAHCIHLSDEEWDILATRGCIVAHCPSSNIALGSGRMELDRLRKRGVDWVLASDIGAGPDICQLGVIKAFLATHAGKCNVSACEAFAHASICAIPERLIYGLSPARLIVLKSMPDERDAENYLQSLLAAYAGVPSDLILGINFGGNWLRKAVTDRN